MILPRIETHAKIYFRGIRCPANRADRIAETVALAWKWFLKLEDRGKDATQFVSAIATFAARAVKAGRRLVGLDWAKDVMDPANQQRHGFAVERLPDISLLPGPIAEALTDNMATPPPDAAAFRIDFPRWLQSLPDRSRRLAEELMIGERTLETARRFGMSEGRVSQLRRKLSQDWARFHGEPLASVA
jgi:hypothetical protein